MTFDEAFLRLIGHEGGYVNDPRDPGGETKFGISKRSYPTEDIKGLSLERAKSIYRRDFWQAAGCEAVPEAVRFDLFDAAVNSGVKQAVKFLQLAAHIPADGVFGAQTRLAVNSLDGLRLVARFNGHRLDYMNNLATWPSFGRGWAQRIAENLMRL